MTILWLLLILDQFNVKCIKKYLSIDGLVFIHALFDSSLFGGVY